jgi:hypothetical protein
MSRCISSAAIATLVASLGACAAPSHPACAPGTGSPMTLFTLYFGEAIRDRPDLTAQEWQSFLDHTVTVTLPNGYTTLDANGGWMSPVSHNTVQEPTKVLIAALPDTPEGLTAINRIRADYQTQFHQLLVGMTVEPVCATF